MVGGVLYWIVLYAYLGLVAGYFLSKISPEEMKPGKKYFRYFQAFLMLVMALVSLYFLGEITIYVLIVAFIGIVISFLKVNPYLIFGLVLGYSKDTFSIVIGSLVFVFGMFEYSLKLKKNMLLMNLLYFVVPFFIVVLLDLSKCCGDNSSIALLCGYSLGYAYKLIFNK